MTVRENEELQQAKTFVLNWQQSIDSATEDGLLAGFAEYMADNYLWRGMHPFHEQTGSDSVIDVFYRPFRRAFSAVQRRQDIFFAGRNQIDDFNSVWVASMGHFMGLFDQPFIGIPPHQKIVMIRYAEFHKIEKNQISETALFIDLLHLMAQVGLNPIMKQTGVHLIQPGPQTHDGLLFADHNLQEGKATLGLINRMIARLMKASMQPLKMSCGNAGMTICSGGVQQELVRLIQLTDISSSIKSRSEPRMKDGDSTAISVVWLREIMEGFWLAKLEFEAIRRLYGNAAVS